MFHRQPLKALYILCFVIKKLIIFPFPLLAAILIPSSTPSKAWSIKKYLAYRFFRDLSKLIPTVQLGMFPFNVEVPDGTFKNCKFVWVPGEKIEEIQEPVKSFAQRSGVEPETVSGFWYFKEGHYSSQIKEADPQEKMVFCVHGGAHFHGSAYPTNMFGLVPNGILKHSLTIHRAFSIDYRRCSTAPFEVKNTFPAALMDVIAGYRYILSLGFQPQNVFLVGDSSGGNLALALVRYLAETRPTGLAIPGNMLLLSPWSDITHSKDGPSSSIRLNAKYDLISFEYVTYGRRAYLGKTWTLDEAKVNPYIASTSSAIEPREGEFQNYPRTFVVAGEIEWNRDDSILVADYLKRDNPQPGHVSLYIVPDEGHDILIFKPFKRQHTEILTRVAQWIDNE